MRILSIDPGNIDSAYVLYDSADHKIIEFGKMPNHDLLSKINSISFDVSLIEMIACYGMPVSKTVFDTCVWIGRYFERIMRRSLLEPNLVFRKDVKMTICGMMKAKDGNIIQALKDKYGDKGTKKEPGFFFGFSSDVWQAFAIVDYWITENKY